MIISRTPHRISFFGGGTDYPQYYLEHGGKVLGAAINQYCYLNVRYLPPFFEHKHSIVYSKREDVKTIAEIQHPAVREVFRYLDVKDGKSIHHDGDIPARSGMGSSSAFTVGLLHSMHALNKYYPTKQELVEQAIHVEQNMIKENVGSQDQTFVAYGGLNYIEFKKSGKIEVEHLELPIKRLEAFQNHLMLFFTGLSRISSHVASDQIQRVPQNTGYLENMKKLVDEGYKILYSEKPLSIFGELLNETWSLKKQLSSQISNHIIDEIYDKALKNGAIGGKMLGAGGGGFMLFFVPPEKQQKVRSALSDYIHVPFSFDFEGSKIIVDEPNYKTC